MTPEDRIEQLEYQVEVLELRIANLLGREGDGERRFGMTASEYRIAHLLAHMAPEIVSKTAMFEARKPDGINPNDGVHIKIVDVFLSRIRQKLKDTPIEIKTAHGAGYYMTSESADAFYGRAYPDLGRAA